MQLISVEELQEALESIHREVEERSNNSRQKFVEQHNAKTNIVRTNFQIGDLVMVRNSSKKGHKLSLFGKFQDEWWVRKMISRSKSKIWSPKSRKTFMSLA